MYWVFTTPCLHRAVRYKVPWQVFALRIVKKAKVYSRKLLVSVNTGGSILVKSLHVGCFLYHNTKYSKSQISWYKFCLPTRTTVFPVTLGPVQDDFLWQERYCSGFQEQQAVTAVLLEWCYPHWHSAGDWFLWGSRGGELLFSVVCQCLLGTEVASLPKNWWSERLDIAIAIHMTHCSMLSHPGLVQLKPQTQVYGWFMTSFVSFVRILNKARQGFSLPMK